MSLHTQQGFTLTELLVTLAISSVVVASMYGVFVQQQRVFTQQEQLTEARQNARLSMDAMLAELRMAGFDPSGLARDSQNEPAGIREATGTTLRFTRDLNCNGTLARGSADTTNEDIAFERRPPTNPSDPNDACRPWCVYRQGFLDGNRASGANQPLANNITRLDFCYFLATAPPDPGTCTLDPAGRLDDIRAVQITLTARATSPDPHYTDTDPHGDPNFIRFHKATLTSIVRLRNLGLNHGGGVLLPAGNGNDPC